MNCNGDLNTCSYDDGSKTLEVENPQAVCRLSRIEAFRQMFDQSILNVFIGGDQMRIHRKVLGDCIDPCWFLPPPIDTDHFRVIPNIKRKKGSVISMSGKIHHWVKGQPNLIKHIEENPRYTYTIYSEQDPKSQALFAKYGERVKYLPPIPYEKLPEEYNKHEFVFHQPQGWEPGGRSPFEGALCGCIPIINDRVGYAQQGLPTKREELKEAIKTGPIRFWREIERRL